MPRPVCQRCRRPKSVCYCASVPSIETKTRVVIVQHPREREAAIGTGHMASLCLPNSELHVGYQFGSSQTVRETLSDPSRPAVVLYPGPDARDIVRDTPAGPVTLVVVDGTWANASKLVRRDPLLKTLPRYAFKPGAPSEYRIRREPRAHYVSTIESLVQVLGVLEGSPDRFLPLLEPFRVMVDRQIDCEKHHRAIRSRHRRRIRRVPRPHPVLGDADADLVCMAVEANAWPYQPGVTRPPPQLVHAVAERLSTGETFECVVGLDGPLAPGTSGNIGLSEQTLLAGTPTRTFRDAFQRFLGPHGVVCSWGPLAAECLTETGVKIPNPWLDLRVVARRAAASNIGALNDWVTQLGLPRNIFAEGRAGSRLASMAAITRWMAQWNVNLHALASESATSAPGTNDGIG